MQEDVKDNELLPLEIQFHLLKQQVTNTSKEVEHLGDKVFALEKSEVATQQQLKIVFSSLDEIKNGQNAILDKLESKDKEDKEALKNTIQQNREIKLLLVGAVISTLVAIVLPLIIKI